MTFAKEIPLEEPPESPSQKEHFKNDIGYADAFVARNKTRIRFVTDEKVWVAFSPDNGWQRDQSGNCVRVLAVEFARELYAEACRKAAGSEPKAGAAMIQAAAGLGNKGKIDPMLSFAQCHPAVAITSPELDREPMLVGVENGFVNIETGAFSPHDEGHLITRRLATAYVPGATAPVFERFLVEVQPDMEVRAFLQRWAGYCLSGSIREHVLPFHFGCGSNGKGVFLEHGLLALAGSYGAKLTNSLIYSNERGNPPFLEIAGLCGKRLALGEENAAGAGLNENFLKGATGADRQKGRFHYADFVEYDPSAKLALVGNHRPRVEGRDHGFWRRFVMVDWPVTIDESRRDPTLPEKIKGEMPGILNWCLAGAREWAHGGLRPPESCRTATERFRVESDPLAGFAELFRPAEGGWITKARAFEMYCQWAQEEGIAQARRLTKRGLSFRLMERGWSEGKVGHGKHHAWLDVEEVENADV